MDEGKSARLPMAVLAVIAVSAFFLSGYAVLSEDGGDGYDSVRYTIYFGMDDRDDGQVQAVEDYVVSEMERNGYGYNLERVTGGYSDNGVPMKDRVTLKFITTDRDPDVIRDIIDGTKDMFGISAVFLEKDLVDYSFC